MCFRRQISFSRNLLLLFPLKFYHVPHRWQQQHPVKCKILDFCKCLANDSRLLVCNTEVICSVVPHISKDHDVFIYKVRQSLNPLAWRSFENMGTTQITMAEYSTKFKSSPNMLVPLYQATWHHVPDICTLDTHSCEKLQFNLCEWYL